MPMMLVGFLLSGCMTIGTDYLLDAFIREGISHLFM